MNFKIKVKEKIYDIKITDRADVVDIRVGERSFVFGSKRTSEEKDFTVSEFGQAQKNLSKKEIKATIGGIVSDIFVKEGEEVKEGQKILTLLAMKMENEITADFSGVVKKILVRSDQAVKEGEILIRFV